MLIRLSMLALLAATPALAETATGDAIRAAIAGNTVQGNMTSSGAYSEFYAVDGVIKGKDYAGEWTIDADRMCFKYGEDPATCWNAAIKGDAVTWINDGNEAGTGTIVAGNPNGF